MGLLLVARDDISGRGLPLAEQSARRYWRGVEGGTVLNHNSSYLQENIGHHSTKEKLIVFINGSKNGNVWGSNQTVVGSSIALAALAARTGVSAGGRGS